MQKSHFFLLKIFQISVSVIRATHNSINKNKKISLHLQAIKHKTTNECVCGRTAFLSTKADVNKEHLCMCFYV